MVFLQLHLELYLNFCHSSVHSGKVRSSTMYVKNRFLQEDRPPQTVHNLPKVLNATLYLSRRAAEGVCNAFLLGNKF